MAKAKPSIPVLPISPITLVCPLCHAKPGKDCETPSGMYLPLVHVARIKAAAKFDRSAKKKSAPKPDVNQIAVRILKRAVN